MSFYSKMPNLKPIDIWNDLKDINGRIIETIPFGSSIENMEGFICISGKDKDLPLLTFCVSNPTKDKCLVTNIVFKNAKHYSDFIDSLNVDYVSFFAKDKKWD